MKYINKYNTIDQYNADTNFEQVVQESFPPQTMWDALTGVEGEIALTIANNPNQVLRGVLNFRGLVTIESGDRTPAVSDDGLPIIGLLGQVRRDSDRRPLTSGLHVDEIDVIVNGPTGLFKSSYLSYAGNAPRVYATIDQVQIDCCTWDYDTRAAAIAANGDLLFPQLQNVYFDGLMSQIKNQDPLYSELSNQYIPMYAQGLQALQASRNLAEESAA